jgi:hypothetical protein
MKVDLFQSPSPQYYNRPAMSDLNDVGMPPVFFDNFHLHPPETGFVCKEGIP